MTYDDPDPLKARQGIKQGLAGRSVQMVSRFVHCQDLRFLSKCGRDLGPLSLAMAQGLPPQVPVLTDIEDAPDPGGAAARVFDEILKGSGTIVRALWAIYSVSRCRDMSGLGTQKPCGKLEHGGLPDAVGTHDPRPAATQMQR